MITPYEIFWLFVAPATLFSWYHIGRNVINYIPRKIETPPNPHPRITFSIAARKLTPILKTTVAAIRDSCSRAGFNNYDVKLVVDEMDNNVDYADVILVPKEFTCKSRYKARALQYALRFLPNTKDEWILHLDEDALVTTQCVQRILSYIKKGGNPVANGPTVFLFDGNVITFYAEAQRQWTFYWLMDQVTTSTVHWLNGSNLLIRSDIEQSVGWDFVNCFISEDARFGYEATKKHGKIFGWHGGLTLEKPPLSTKSLFKQRTRWFWGSILNLRYVPRQRLPRRIYTISVWLCGFVLTLFFFILIIGVYREPWFTTLPLVNIVSVTGVFWLVRYQIGVYQNLRYSPLDTWKKVLLHLGIIPLAPVIDLLCAVPAVMALIRHPKSFEVTTKRA